MKVKRFKSLSSDEDYEDYFQELIDNWDIELEVMIDEDEEENYIKIRIGKDLWKIFPNPERYNKHIELVIECQNLDKYFNFMEELKKCIDHLISSSDGKISCNRIVQDEFSNIKIEVNLNY